MLLPGEPSILRERPSQGADLSQLIVSVTHCLTEKDPNCNADSV